MEFVLGTVLKKGSHVRHRRDRRRLARGLESSNPDQLPVGRRRKRHHRLHRRRFRPEPGGGQGEVKHFYKSYLLQVVEAWPVPKRYNNHQPLKIYSQLKQLSRDHVKCKQVDNGTRKIFSPWPN